MRKIAGLDTWKHLVRFGNKESRCCIAGLTVTKAAELLYGLEKSGEVEIVLQHWNGEPFEQEYALRFADEETAHPFDEFAYTEELGLFLMPLKKFKCNKCGRKMKARTLDNSLKHDPPLRPCGGIFELVDRPSE